MIQTEDVSVSHAYRKAYTDGMKNVIALRRKEIDAKREAEITPEAMKENAQAYRRGLMKTLGWPLTEERTELAKVTVSEEKEYEPGILMRRLTIETLPGLPFYGILLIPETEGRHPLVISQHGGWGTPEQTADLHRPNRYKDMSARLARSGAVVFAPQLLLWREDEGEEERVGYNLPHNRQARENELRQIGSSIAAVEIYSIMRALDYLVTLDFVDADRIGMTGLSYGGFYTQMTAAIDTRIKAAATNAFYNDRYHYCWGDFSWFGSAYRFKDAEICALIAPRHFCIHVGETDAVFDVNTALPEIERIKPFFAAQNAADKLKIIVSPVNHTLTDTGEELDFLMNALNEKI
ncbi:MAG: dienelactone hydrolase family protein [Clostridia bacterium]|nr:dienelactone hydrolase family protein [Clostridia bacterium]